MRQLSILSLASVGLAQQFLFERVRNNEPLCFSGHHKEERAGTEVFYDLTDEDDNTLAALQNCKVVKNDRMRNNDYLPLTMDGRHPTMVQCDIEFGQLVASKNYKLSWYDYENKEFTKSVNTFQITDDLLKRSRFLSGRTCFNPMTNRELDRDDAVHQFNLYRRQSRQKRDTPRPSITSVTPRDASPRGGVLITIFGENLFSRKLDLSGVQDESENQGENFRVWFERDVDGVIHSVPCDVDRMLGLHVKQLPGQDWLACRTRPFPIWTRWYLRVQIDDGAIMHSSGIDFTEAEGPTVNYFFPQASSPAKPAGAFDYAGAFYTPWFDTDDNTDGIEDESLAKHMAQDRGLFQKCYNPLAIEVMVKETMELFVASANENADGNLIPTFNDALQGFRCEDTVQTVDGLMCPDVKVRYRCLPGLGQMEGRIYTDIHGRMDHPDFHANRIHETPQIRNDNDGFKSEANIFLNNGENCGAHANCGVNHRLNLRVVSGNDGLIQYVANAPIPGAYNYTFTVFHNGDAVVNKRYLNYLSNEELYPTNYEVYPQILSVEPQMGSVAGGTLLTIRGTGFVDDGLGGTVTVMVGEDACDVESMTETEIKCRTVGAPQEPATFAESRTIEVVAERSCPHNHRNHWALGTGQNEVSSADMCKDMCLMDASCLAFIFQESDASWNGCWHIDYMGPEFTDEAQTAWMADGGDGGWHHWANAVSGYVKFSSRGQETNCYTGRGELYAGSLAVSKRGENCMAGTFCRNENPADHVVPYCQEEDGDWADCHIQRCDEIFGKYAGNRGASVKWGPHTKNYDDLWRIDSAQLRNGDWTHLDGKISVDKRDSMYVQGDHDFSYNLKARNYFVAPFDGVYSFHTSGDNEYRLFGEYNDDNGHFKHLAGYWGWCHPSLYGCHYTHTISEKISLTKGQKIPLQTTLKEINGGDYVQLSVGYHGKDDAGTWIDEIPRNEMQQDSYVYDHQRLTATASGEQDYIFLTFKFDADLQNDGIGLGTGEEFDHHKRAKFRINWCGDNNNCFTSSTFNVGDSGIENTIRDELKTWRNTECQQDGTFNPELYHGEYESDSDWPHGHHFRAGQGAWCGRKAHEVHNHDIWNTNLGRKFDSNTYDDICFAYKGNIEQLAIYGSFEYETEGSDETTQWRGWMVRDVGWSSADWTWTCFSLTDVMFEGGTLYGLTVKDQRMYDVSNVRVQNAMASPIYIDELRIGKMRGTSFNMIQTRKALSFDGMVPIGFAVWRNRGTWGSVVRIHINNWNDISSCGYQVTLPTILPPEGYVNSGDTTMVDGADWTTANPPFNEPWTDFISSMLLPDTAKDYRYMKLNYLDSADNKREIYDAFVLRRSQSDEEMASNVVIRYGDSEETLEVTFHYNFWPVEFTALLREKWPELGADGLNIDTYRSGWCQAGYQYYIRGHQHGNMKEFTFTGTPTNTRIHNPNFESRVIVGSAVMTAIMPGSVMATDHHVPQVVIVANGQRSACDNCDFKYLDSLTPELVQVTTENGNTIIMGESVTVTFNVKSYAGSFDNTVISVGDAPVTNCDYSTSDVGGDTIVAAACIIGATGQGSDHKVMVDIPELGRFESTDTYEVGESINSYSPMVGSTHGGTIVSVQGSGFAPGQIVTLNIGGADTQCDSAGFEVTYSTMTCRTLPNDSISGGVSPMISFPSQHKFSVIGGEEFTVTGSNLDPQTDCTDSALMIGTEKAEIISWTNMEIRARSVAQAPDANAMIKVYVCNHGYSNSIAGSVALDISTVDGAFSSIAGGRELTIDGYGFKTDGMEADSVEVSVGDIPCAISSLTNTQITCNTGAHNNRVSLKITAAGFTYADNSPTDSIVEIEAGNEVLWSWMISIPGTTPIIHLQRVSSSGDAETSNNQYWSESMSGNEGKFLKHFPNPGTYHYSTGYIDSATIAVTGTIRVVAATDKPYMLNVNVNGHSATHQGSSNNAQPSGACNAVGSSTANAPSEAGFYVTYSWAVTPVLKQVNYNNPNIEGMMGNSPTATVGAFFNGANSFDPSACSDSISITLGDYDCENTDANSSKQSCVIAPGDSLNTQETHKLNAHMAGLGNAYFFDYSFDTDTNEHQLGGHLDVTFAPYVSSSSPQQFSRLGDVVMTFTGQGFESAAGDVMVEFRNAEQRFNCEIVSVSYTEIVCHMDKIASSLKLADSPLSGFIMFGENSYPVQTNAFSTSASHTPTITSVSPAEVSTSGETLTISGSRLNGLVVHVGGQECTDMVANANSATCTIPSITTGRHMISVTAQYGGVQRQQLRIQSNLSAATITPAAGGLNGGTLVTVSGFGFDEDTVIEVYGASGERLCEFCHIFDIPSPTELVFYSPRVMMAQTATVQVKHEYIPSNIATIDFVYSDSSATVSDGAVSGDIDAIVGGETLTITGSNFGSCENIEVEIVRAKDPCAVGMHECDHQATCTPTADGMDYTCSCPTFVDLEWCDEWCQLWRENGNGRECIYTIRRGLTTLEEAEDKCEKEHGERVLEINNDYDKENLKQTLIGTEGSTGTSSRGVIVRWFGDLKCIRGNDDSGDWVFETDDELGACDTWGSESDEFKKRVLCRRYAYRNCYDHELGDNGRYTYNGRKSTTITGKQCNHWDTTSWWEDYGRLDQNNGNNYCRNPWNGDEGINCALGQVWDSDHQVREGCGIPKCSDLHGGVERQQCTVHSFAPRREGTYSYRFENDTWSDDDICYFGESHDNRLHVSHRCSYKNRWPPEIRFEPVDEANNVYRIIRNKLHTEVEKYLTIDPLAESSTHRVLWTNEEADRTSAATEFYVDPDTFDAGTFTIRQGEYFVYDAQDNGQYMAVVHQDNIGELVDRRELSFVIQCTSDNYGALIEQPPTQFSRIDTLTPTCTGDSLSVDLPSLEAGAYKAVVRSSEYGQAVNVVDLNYNIQIDSWLPDRIGTGGGTEMILSGTGFSDGVTATLCGEELVFVSFTPAVGGAAEELRYLTVPFDVSNCADGLNLSVNDKSNGNTMSTANGRKRRNAGVTVDASLTPTITSVMPKKGGTMGGTTITVEGAGFGSDMAAVSVTIFDVPCDVQSATDTEITCVTNAFPRDRAQVPVAPVVFIDGGPGTAVSGADDSSAIEFWYVDRWSSPYTWGCTDDSCKPKAGEIIVVPAGQVILLDETTPILAVLIIDGGTMIWDRQDGIELHMQYGIVNSGGHFEIGTEDDPFCAGKATIIMYGHQRSINLPIYGAKVFAVRFGTFDVHGCPKTTTWTELDVTAETGDDTITLTHPVVDDWFVGDEIIIAATGDLTNFHRSEKRVIASVSDDGYQVTVTEPLEHRHIAVCTNGPNDNGQGWGWRGEICTRAEVGLLTRNVKMMGNVNNAWTEELPECELGPGTAFGTQTCFQNRFGHETGSDQFGSVLFLHKPNHAKIEFMEVTHSGQAFNLARYSIHFHTPGSLPTSYVRGCSIHNAFNRAMTLHGVHDLLVEYNVAYNIMGLAFFLEDAVEENNILRYNLGIMNKKSSSLLNVDSTPSVFWIPNPNNIFYGNRAAGCSHFGFWFNPPEDGPTGPSAKDPQYADIAPKHRPLGTFYNNTAHSMGKYGMWIFVDLAPTGPDGMAHETEPMAAKFGALPDSMIDLEGNAIPENTFGFFAWHCERGAEIATGGALQFHNMIAANNWIAGLAGKETFLHTYAEDGMEDQAQLFKRNIVIGHLGGDVELDACGDMGIETPWKFFAFTVDDIDFYNFDQPTPDKASDPNFGMASELEKRRCVAIDPCYGSNAFDCGTIVKYSNVRWHNSPRRATFAWEHEAAFYDKDGSFAGQGADKFVIAASDTYNPNLCTRDTTGKYTVANTDPDIPRESFPAMVCDGEKNGERFKPHRFMFNNGRPDSVEGTMAKFENEYGFTRSPFRNCRPRGKGWMVMLNGETEYSMVFEDHEHISNISFTGDIDDFEQDEWLTIRHDFPEQIDFAHLGLDHSREFTGVRINGSWPSDPLTLDAYNYQVETETQPFSVRYTFNGKEATENPQVSEHGGALTYGMAFNLHPQFHKCFYPDCIEPEPEPATPPPPLADCNLLDCFGGALPADYDNVHIQASQKVIVDAAAVAAAAGVIKFGGVIVDGTLTIPGDALAANEELIIEADHLVVNTGEGETLSATERKRRDAMFVSNGAIIIGTADNPIPCDRKVIIKINGDKNSPSLGALPGSIPIGQKAIGGIGGIQMHGCPLSVTATTLTNTIVAGEDSITVDDDISEWKVGDEIAVATSDFETRHTEYFTINAISGQTITLSSAAQWTHTGSAASGLDKLGRSTHQGAEVALLTRNIVVDGTDVADAKVGGRVLVTSWTKHELGHDYVRQGYGQFSFVEFKGMGQYGYTNFDDLRSQILFYQIDANGDEVNGQLPSYVRGCAFHHGYHTAIAAMFDSNNLQIDNNVIFGAVGSAIRTDSAGLQITNNVIGAIEQQQLYQQIVEGQMNTNFADDKMPAGIDTSETEDQTIVISGNRIAGVEGSCYAGNGLACDASESCSDSNVAPIWTDNKGHSCLRGYYIMFSGSSDCTKISGFTFYKISFYGVTTQSATTHMVVDNVIIEDSVVGVFAISVGPDAVMHESAKKTVTVKNSYISGKGDNYDCDYDEQWQEGMYAASFCGRQRPPITGNSHTAIVISDFLSKKNGFPACPWFDQDANMAMYGNTCVVNTEFANYNRKCGQKDHLVLPNKKAIDHIFPLTFVSGNSVNNVNADDIVKYQRPSLSFVNIADCVDLYCDGLKKPMLIDQDGGIFGEAGTMLPESEYEWDGITRVQPDGQSLTYVNTQDGLGDYRIPAPMETRLDGSRIPMNEVYSDVGIVRNNDCTWNSNVPGWWCPRGSGANELRYYDVLFESMDADHERRRLSPLAVRADGIIDIINGPGDHSCCIGYACFVRLSQFHTTVACGKHYEYFFSSTTPMSMKFHFPQADETCKIKVSLYTKRPNRLDLMMDDVFQVATNARQVGENIEWDKPDNSVHVPEVLSHNSGANFFQREAQQFHFIMSGGHTYQLDVVQTLVLELSVMTELTEDEFYDNGNLANNIAALLGIDPSKIRVMNVIREDGGRRRRRRAAAGMYEFSIPGRFRRQDSDSATSLQIEITPDSNTASGQRALADTAETIIAQAADVAATVGEALGAEVLAEVAVAQPPPQPEEPEPPVTLAELLGVEELQPGDNVTEFMENIEEVLGQPLDTLETAEDAAAAAQAEQDAANEPIVYKTPTRMAIRSQPSDPQILSQAMFQHFVIEMYDQDDLLMENVGYVGDPYTVLAFMTDITGTNNPAVDGTTTAAFAPVTGIATFDNLIIQGDVESCTFTFTINNPSGTGIAQIKSELVTFTSAPEEGECVEDEGNPFDRKESWSATCDNVCLSPCSDLGSVGLDQAGPQCQDVATCDGGDGSTFATCTESGCGCNMTAVPSAMDIDPAQYIAATCDGSGLEMRINKCILNQFGFKLKDLYINGPEVTDDFTTLASSADNNCRGQLGYQNGPEYVFRIDRTFSDCNTRVSNNGTHATYDNAIQGSAGVNNGVISRQRNLFASFGCTFKIDLTASLSLGQVGTQSMEITLNTVAGEFDVAMAVYEDSSYTVVADENFEVVVPDHIHLGMALTESDNFLLQARRCWVTPDNNAENTVQFDIINNGCPNPEDVDNIVIYENGATHQARISFAAFHFLGQAENSELYMHCALHVCDQTSAADCQATCDGRRRREVNYDMLNVVSLPIRIDMSVGKSECEIDEDCVTCVPQYNGKKCSCPRDYVLQDDNSCVSLDQSLHIPTPAQLAARSSKASFHERLQARLRGR